MNKLYFKLNSSLEGFVVTDDDNLRLYSTDASVYQIKPQAVAFPKNTEDCQKIVAFAANHKIPVIPRGAGTSLGGQAVGDGIVVDVSRFMNHIVRINPATQTAVVQPGVIPTSINSAAAPFGLFFPPNPSTDNRCNIGGMVGNNAWGANAPLYGDTSDHIRELEIILSDASVHRFTDINQQELDKILEQDTLPAHIYSEVISQVRQQRQQIQSYPWYTQRIPNNMAYRLHKLLNRITDPQSLGPPFNMSQLICGSEGTLGLITEVTVALQEKPAHRNLMCVHFPSLYEALNAVPLILSQSSATIELLDKNLIELACGNPDLAQDSFWIDSSAHAILLIEIWGNDAKLLDKMNNSMRTTLNRQFEQLHFHTLTDDETQHAWRIRRSALGMLFGMAGGTQAVSFVEDTAVSVEHLTDFVQRVMDVMSMLKIKCVYYGSVSRGLIHIRPLLDLTLPLHKEYLKEIQTQIVNLVVQFGGSISAKHGDGRIRAASLNALLDESYLEACRTIKRSFDPDNIFNPGSIFSDRIELEHIRIKPRPIKTPESFKQKLKIFDSSLPCHGAAVCRQTAADPGICPTYKAIRDEALSTRGRANIIRQAFKFIENEDPKIDYAAIDRALNHCLACKACQTGCPAHVDIATIKTQWLNINNKSHAKSIENRIFQNFPAICRVMSVFPKFSNLVNRSPITKSVLGMSKYREPPAFSSSKFSKEFKKLKENKPHQPKVIIINDVFSEFFEPDVGTSAVAVISKMGYTVRLSPIVTSLRMQISTGWFDHARDQLKNLVNWLDRNATSDSILIGLEPSEVMAIRDECMDISRGTSWYSTFANISAKILLLDEFVLQNQQTFVDNLSRDTFNPRNITLHTHCHQKSSGVQQCSIDALHLLPNCSVNVVQTGCCGMAGYFGYEKENYDLSIKIAQMDLLPAISDASNDDLIVASGASCRAQINSLSDRTAMHASQVYSKYMNNLIE